MNEAIQASGRQIWGLTIYRWLLSVVFLLVAFNEFPEHRASIALGFLVVIHSFAAIGMALKHLFLTSNALDDEAERKTRHTIVMAAQQQMDAGHGDFWAQVDDRVAAERRGHTPAKSGVAAFFLVAWHTISRALGDYASIAIAWIISSPY